MRVQCPLSFDYIRAGLGENNSNSSTLENDEDSLGGMNRTMGSPKLKLPSVMSPAGGGKGNR